MTKKELLAQKKELLATLRRRQIAKEVTDALSFDLTQIIRNVSKTEKINELSEAIIAIENKIDKLPSKTNALLKKKILEEVRKLIAKNTPKIDEIIEKIPKPKDGKNGKDGKTPQKGVDYFTAKEIKDLKKEIQASIPKPKDGINGKDGSPDTPKDIKEKIQKIKGDKWFPAKNIKDLDLVIPTVPQNRSGSEGSAGIPDAPKDGKQYGRQDGGWTEVEGGVVDSVFGRIGDVVAENGDYTTDQVTEGTNKYWDYNADTNPIINVVDPTNPQDAATKNYVDTENQNQVKNTGASTDNAIPKFDGTTGKVIQDTGVTIDDSNNISTPGTVDGRDISVDGAKLDTIETNAEVNNISDANASTLTDGSNADSLHVHTANAITDFDTEVSNNADVSANTTSRHAPVTVTDTPTVDLSLLGQDLQADVVPGGISHNDLAGLQGGAAGQYNHLTNAELAVLQATSGTNTGDQDVYTTVIGNSGSTTANSTTDSLTIQGGTDIDVAVANDNITINYTGSTSQVDPGLTQLRLSGSSSDPVPFFNINSASRLYAVPYKGNLISLYNTSSGKWEVLEFTSANILSTSLTADRNYDIFGYSSAGALFLEATMWSNTSSASASRVTSLTKQDAVYVKSTDRSRKYLGTIRTDTGSFKISDNTNERFIFNYYNRVPRVLKYRAGSIRYTLSSTSYRRVANSSNSVVELIIGVPEVAVELYSQLWGFSSSGTKYLLCGIGINSTTTNLATVAFNAMGTNFASSAYAKLIEQLDEGFYQFYFLEKVFSPSVTVDTFNSPDYFAEIGGVVYI